MADVAERSPLCTGLCTGLCIGLCFGRSDPSEIAEGRRAVYRPEPDLAHLVRREITAFVVADAHHESGSHASDRPGLGQGFDAGNCGSPELLRSAVCLVDGLRTEPTDHRCFEPYRVRATRAHDRAQRGHVVATTHLGTEPPDAVLHRRHEEHPVDAMTLHECERPLGVEALHEHHRRAREQSTDRVDERSTVIQRTSDQHRAIELHEVLRRERIDDRRRLVEHNLGCTRAATRGHRLPMHERHRGQRCIIAAARDRLSQHKCRLRDCEHRVELRLG